MKPFLGHSKIPMGLKLKNLEKPLLGGYPKDTEFQNSEYAGHQVGPNEAGSQNFSSLALMV